MSKCKFKRIPNWTGGTGMVWMIIYPDGTEKRTIMAASGKEAYRKKDMERIYNSESMIALRAMRPVA